MSLMFPKSPPLRDPAHLIRVRAMPCLVCGRPPPSEAAHIRMGLSGGTSLKPGDDLTVPLCHDCHATQHRDGEVTFWRESFQFKNVLRDVLRGYARSLYARDQ